MLSVSILMAMVPSWAAVLTVPDTHPTIQAAIDAASEGDKVNVKAGVYREHLYFKNGIDLAGEGQDKVVVKDSTVGGPLLRIEDCTAGTVSEIAFEFEAQKQTNGEEPSIVSVCDSAIELHSCLFKNGVESGLEISGTSCATVSECTIAHCDSTGILVIGTGCKATLLKNSVIDNGAVGICVFDHAGAVITENRCKGNRLSGIRVASGASACVSRNTCDSGQEGIYFDKSATGEVEGNSCSNNSNAGVFLTQSSNVTVRGNRTEGNTFGINANTRKTNAIIAANICCKNKDSGISIQAGAECRVEDNVCEENGRHGIVISNWFTKATLSGNACNRNAEHGICFMSGCEGTVADNTCNNNSGSGLCVTDEGTRADTGSNLFKDNVQGDAITMPGVAASCQEQVYEGISWAHEDSDFDYLERLAARLCEHGTRDFRGDWGLQSFYQAFTIKSGTLEDYERANFLAQLQRWRAAYPNSVRPLVALASYHISRARKIRPRNRTGEEQKDQYHQHMRVAGDYLSQAMTLGVADPHIYACSIWLAYERGDEQEQTRALLKKGLAVDKYYFPLHSFYLLSLKPHDDEKCSNCDQYIEEAANSTADVLGDQIYALLTYDYASYEPRLRMQENAVLDRARVYKGFEELQAQYPKETRYPNMMCEMACIFKDQERARSLFEEIDVSTACDFAWDLKEDTFRSYKQWAYGLASYPKAENEEEEFAEFIATLIKGVPIAGVLMLFLGLTAVALIVARSARR